MKTRKSILAWFLTLAMVVTGLTVPSASQSVQASDTENLSVESGYSTTSLTMAANEYGSDYIGDILFNVPTSINTKSLVATKRPVVSVSMTVNSISQSTGSLTAMLYTQDSSYNWNQSEAVSVTAGQEINLSYDLTQMSWEASGLAKIGFRFADTATDTAKITYTINSAVVKMGEGSGSSSSSDSSSSSGTNDGLASDAQVDSSEVSVTATKSVSNDYWHEYSFTIANHTSAAVSKIQVVLPTSGEPANMQSFESLSGVYNSEVGGVIVYYSGSIDAGGSVTLGKIGFNPQSVTVGTPYVRGVDCDPPSGSGTSSSELNYELTGETKTLDYSETPYGKHGKLSLQKVSGYGNAPVIVDESGQPFQLRGASTHGIQWGEMKPYVNEGAFQSLRDEWGVNMVRLAGYVTQGGYTQGSKDSMDETFQKGVEAATKLGMYVIVDWHIHAENPHTTIEAAKTFFQTYATKYKDYGNVIFEICNEPTGVQWYTDGSTDLYSYCKTISQIIRDCGSDSIIVCGTNTWSQDVDDVVKKPLADDGFENIMYTFHFYSGSHYEDKMKKVKQAVSDGTPIFVTEFGICDASGNGGFDTANADAWIELLDSYNISYACWSLCNKNESASYLATSCTKTTGGWTSSDLATTGIWLVNTYRAHEDAENGVTPTTKAPTTVAPATTKTPTTTKTPATTEAAAATTKTPTVTKVPADVTEAPDTSSATETPGQDLTVTDPQTTAEPTGSLDTPQPEGTLGTTAVPSGSEATKAPATTQTPVATVTPTVMSGSISYEPTVTATPTVTVTKKATVRLKKSVIRIKKGQKARIVIRKKATGDKVKKYTVSGKKNIITISKAGVVKGRKKGTVRVKVVMKSGASAWCRIVVRS